MTFNPLIPSPASSPKSSVVGIQTNFAAFASVFSSTSGGVVLNHYSVNDNQQGKHGAVIFDQIIDPTINLTLCSLYAKNTPSGSPPSSQPQLFARIKTFLPNGQPNTPMQLTYNTVSTSSPYQSFMIGGYLIFWATIPSALPGPTYTITLSPAPTALLNVQITSLSGAGISIQPVSASSFTINKITSNLTPYPTLSWMAIGKV